MKLYKVMTTIRIVQYVVAGGPDEATLRAGRRRASIHRAVTETTAEPATGEPEQWDADWMPYGATDCTVGEWLAGDGDAT